MREEQTTDKSENNAKKQADLARLLSDIGQLQRSGKFAEAEMLCHKVLELDAGNVDATFALVSLMMGQGHAQEACNFLTQSIDRYPVEPRFPAYLGLVLSSVGQADAAVQCYERALQVDPDFLDAKLSLGNLFHRRGDLPGAIREYSQAIAQRPDFAPAHYNLAIVYAEAGETDKAVRSYEAAVDYRPDYHQAYYNLGHQYKLLGMMKLAAEAYRQAAEIEPSQPLYWQALTDVLGAVSSVEGWEEFVDDVETCLHTANIEYQGLARLVAKSVVKSGDYESVVTLAPEERCAQVLQRSKSEGFSFVSENSLLAAALDKLIFTDPDIEILLTNVRNALTRLIASETRDLSFIDDATLRFMSLLAKQCYLNEYVYAQTSEETNWVSALKRDCAERLRGGTRVAPAEALLLATFGPIEEDWGRAGLLDQVLADGGYVAAVLSERVEKAETESELAAAIPCLTRIDDEEGGEVRAQYEQHPYPRWTSLPCVIPCPVSTVLGQLFPSLHKDAAKFPRVPKVLVAGCGTGRHALLTAKRFSACTVLGTDLSRPSLGYAARMARELAIPNATFALADLMAMSEVPERFDIVESVGLLHHLVDPEAGLRVLVGLLNDDGFMKLGFYSRLGRKVVTACQEMARQHGLSGDPAGIREFRSKILNRTNDADLDLITRYRDFYSISGCRDLVFHARERLYDLPEIKRLLEAAGLDFIGFEFDRDPVHLSRFRETFPGGGYERDLDAWHTYENENPTAFSSMYQFWVRKKPGGH